MVYLVRPVWRFRWRQFLGRLLFMPMPFFVRTWFLYQIEIAVVRSTRDYGFGLRPLEEQRLVDRFSAWVKASPYTRDPAGGGFRLTERHVHLFMAETEWAVDIDPR